YHSHLHGITIGAADRVLIQNNTLIHAEGDRSLQNNGDRSGLMHAPPIRVDDVSLNVTIKDNVAESVNGFNGQAGWSLSGNVHIQDANPSGVNYYGDLFVASSMAPTEDGAHNYEIIPGGLIDALNVGASRMQPGWTSS